MIKLLLLAALCARADEASVKIAFVGDSGLSPNTTKVFELIRAEGAEAVVHVGDFGYFEEKSDSPARFEKRIRAALKDVPFFGVLGNHDEKQRKEYIAMLGRAGKDGVCSGALGTDAVCSLPGVDAVFIEDPDLGVETLKKRLAASKAKWKICVWHAPDVKLHPGKNKSGTGPEPLAACLAAGAIIANGHQHHYSRTYLMEDFAGRKVVSKAGEMKLEPGRSISLVSGAGGAGKLDDVQQKPWQAATYARKDADKSGHGGGALFCAFAGIRAECYFKSIDGKTYDTFTLVSGL